MALTHTPAPEIGQVCPDFSLKDVVEGRTWALKDFKDSEVLVVMFICNHCPYVVAIEDRLVALGNSFKGKSVQFLGICSNDSGNYPEDAPEKLAQRAKEKGFPWIYLHDKTQEVAKDFGAVCTPDFFVYDKNRKLAYRGRLDDSWKEPSKVSKEEMRTAIDLLLKGESVPKEQNSSMGCSIKWL